MGKILTYLGKIYEPINIRFYRNSAIVSHNHSFFIINKKHKWSPHPFKTYLNLTTVNQTIDSIIILLIIDNHANQTNYIDKNYRVEYCVLPLLE